MLLPQLKEEQVEKVVAIIKEEDKEEIDEEREVAIILQSLYQHKEEIATTRNYNNIIKATAITAPTITTIINLIKEEEVSEREED